MATTTKRRKINDNAKSASDEWEEWLNKTFTTEWQRQMRREEPKQFDVPTKTQMQQIEQLRAQHRLEELAEAQIKELEPAYDKYLQAIRYSAELHKQGRELKDQMPPFVLAYVFNYLDEL